MHLEEIKDILFFGLPQVRKDAFWGILMNPQVMAYRPVALGNASSGGIACHLREGHTLTWWWCFFKGTIGLHSGSTWAHKPSPFSLQVCLHMSLPWGTASWASRNFICWLALPFHIRREIHFEEQTHNIFAVYSQPSRSVFDHFAKYTLSDASRWHSCKSTLCLVEKIIH